MYNMYMTMIYDTNTARPPESSDSSICFAKYYMQVACKLWILTKHQADRLEV